MTIKELQERKRNLGLSNETLSAMSGVPVTTIQKIFSGTTTSPRLTTMQKLEAVLAPRSPRDIINSVSDDAPSPTYGSSAYTYPSTKSQMVMEQASAYHAYPRQGSYTIEDYYALPDDRRVELIDGVLYDMTTPVLIHQAILGRLHYEFVNCVDRHPECELFLAPSDVRLDNDNRTMVQPDLYIVCNRQDTDHRRLNGAPDFVCEILSPSTRSHDMFLKFNKYKKAGVREYWIVDPEKLQVIVYNLEEDSPGKFHSFHDVIPVGISGGECSIDFERIYQKIARYI